MKLKLYVVSKNNAFHNYQLAKVTRAKIDPSQRIQLFWQCTMQEANDELHDNIKQSLTCVLAYLMQKYHNHLHVKQFLTNT